MELGQITLEGVLIIVIALITLNLLFIGFYILSVLRELKKTLTRARGMMEEVDRSVKTGMDKFIAIERPLEALSTTTNALAGFIKGAGMLKKTTQSILNSSGASAEDEAEDMESEIPLKPYRERPVVATKKATKTTVTVEEAEVEPLPELTEEELEQEMAKEKPVIVQPKRKPKFFSRS
jgi:hypothetical protein